MSAKKFHILVIDDETDITYLLQDILEDEGYRVSTAKNAQEGDEIYRGELIDLVLLDIWMPEEDGLSLLTRWFEQGLKSHVVMMSGHGTIETAVQATKLGAFDFIEKPISIAKLMIAVENVFKKIKLEQRHQALIQQINPNVQIIGKSTAISDLKNQLEQIKLNSLPVLFIGESGTGKSHYARYLHQISNRNNEPFIIVNASALSRDNQRNDIFGSAENNGLIQTAEGGTLFIDNITDLELESQSVFVSLLESGFYFVGDEKVTPNVRICFASQYQPNELIENELVKEDLYYQIQTLTVQIPMLTSYKDDIPEIVNHFVYQFVDYDDLPYRRFSMQALNFLRQYDWPGNVRELKNFIQRVLVLSTEEEITLKLVEELISINHNNKKVKEDAVNIDLPIRDARENFEKTYFLKQLEYCDGNIAKLAERAGLERTNLYRKLKSLGIQYK
ncbi:MAG: sigma-54-dependent Fis family transcriptional regulator [Gammaproteobacteria bacterium]|nr:sigma-54-dependent Fis family transcriptional regulator [Gammaproteobacteria bacterium]